MTAVRSFDDEDELPADPTDFTPYIDPVSLHLKFITTLSLR
jgi:hypothetical protein